MLQGRYYNVPSWSDSDINISCYCQQNFSECNR